VHRENALPHFSSSLASLGSFGSVDAGLRAASTALRMTGIADGPDLVVYSSKTFFGVW
jgi:hypothetical protein